MHRKLELFGNDVGEYLSKLEGDLFDRQDSALQIIITRNKITLRFWIDKIDVYLIKEYIGTIYVECFADFDCKYECSRLSTDRKEQGIMRKYQSDLYPLAEKILNIIRS